MKNVTACCRPENNGAMKKLSHKNVIFSKLETSLAPDSEDRVTIAHIDFAKAFAIVLAIQNYIISSKDMVYQVMC